MFYTKWDRAGKVEKKHRYTKKIQKRMIFILSNIDFIWKTT